MKKISGLVEILLLFPFRSAWCFSAPSSTSATGESPCPDVVSTFSLLDDSGGPYAHCYEVKPPPLPNGAEEDDVELWYPTRRRAFVFEADGVEGNGAESPLANQLHLQAELLSVRQTSFGCGKLGSSVWPSSLALCLHLTFKPESVRGRRVLELGAGCGLPSLLCRDVLGADGVLVTDFWEPDGQGDVDKRKEPIPARLHRVNLEHNVQGDGAKVQRVDWHDPDTVNDAKSFGADFIIGSDLVYYPSNVQPLIDTLKVLMDERGGASEALLISPLPPQAERTALPDFRRKLPLQLVRHNVQMDEIVMHRREDGEKQKFLRIAIVAKETRQ